MFPKAHAVSYVYNANATQYAMGSSAWCANLINSTIIYFVKELHQIYAEYNEEYVKSLIENEYASHSITFRRQKQGLFMGGCASMDVYINNRKMSFKNGEEKTISLNFGVYPALIQSGLASIVISPFVLNEDMAIQIGFNAAGLTYRIL